MDATIALWHERAARYFRGQLKTLHKSQEDRLTEAQRRLSWHESAAEAIWRTIGVNLIDMKGKWIK